MFYATGYWPAVRSSEKFVDKAHQHSNASSKEVSRELKVVGAGIILAQVSRKSSRAFVRSIQYI